MYCGQCGFLNTDNGKYCTKCGAVLVGENCDEANTSMDSDTSHVQNMETSPKMKAPGSTELHCPKCGSKKIQTSVKNTTDVHGGGYGVGKGCLGWLLFGPLGLLCGGLGSKPKVSSSNSTIFVCMDCGFIFDPPIKRELEYKYLVEKIKLAVLLIGIWVFLGSIYSITTYGTSGQQDSFFMSLLGIVAMLGTPVIIIRAFKLLNLFLKKEEEIEKMEKELHLEWKTVWKNAKLTLILIGIWVFLGGMFTFMYGAGLDFYLIQFVVELIGIVAMCSPIGAIIIFRLIVSGKW